MSGISEPEKAVDEFSDFLHWWHAGGGWGGELLAEGHLAHAAWNAGRAELERKLAAAEKIVEAARILCLAVTRSEFSRAEEELRLSIRDADAKELTKCPRCGELYADGDEAEGCRDPECPMQEQNT